MKVLLTIFLFGIFLSGNSQETISKIKTNSNEIKGRMSNEFYKQDISQMKELRSILNLDVFEYYNLKDQYDTDLKKKVYKGTENYKVKFSTLQALKDSIISSDYFLDFEPSYYERNNEINYDLSSKTFSVTNEIYYSSNYNKPNYVQFDKIVFKCPHGITVRKKKVNYGGVDFIDEIISFKIDDETLALKIEKNRSNLKLLFVFNFKGTSKFQDNVLGITYTSYHFMTNVKKIIVYNSKTNEIYFTYE